MGKFPMIQSPLLDLAENNMRPCGGLSHSYLGNDQRKLSRILADDQLTVNSLGLSHEVIATKLQEITERARQGWGDPVNLDDIFEVEFHEARGVISCPWGHPGLYRKSHIKLKHIDSGLIIVWSDLGIHFIEQHGFYQGRGSPYRLEPKQLKKILQL